MDNNVDDERLTLSFVMKEDGVKDLPLGVRVHFIRALIVERKADFCNPLALQYLDEAVAKEVADAEANKFVPRR